MVISEAEKSEISKMHRVHATVMEMLNDRGYLVTNAELNMTKEYFIQHYGDDYFRGEILRTKRRDETDQAVHLTVLVSFVEKLGVRRVKETKSQMEKEGVQRVIFVVKERLTPMAQIECQSSVKVHFELFKETELLINVTKHKAVPEHQLLTEEEKKTLLQKYTLEVTQLPCIQVNEPVAKYYGLRRGQVVKITRRSETAGKYITYCLAV